LAHLALYSLWAWPLVWEDGLKEKRQIYHVAESNRIESKLFCSNWNALTDAATAAVITRRETCTRTTDARKLVSLAAAIARGGDKTLRGGASSPHFQAGSEVGHAIASPPLQ